MKKAKDLGVAYLRAEAWEEEACNRFEGRSLRLGGLLLTADPEPAL